MVWRENEIIRLCSPIWEENLRLVNKVGPWGRATDSEYSLLVKLHI